MRLHKAEQEQQKTGIVRRDEKKKQPEAPVVAEKVDKVRNGKPKASPAEVPFSFVLPRECGGGPSPPPPPLSTKLSGGIDQVDDAENQQPDGARKWKPDASPILLELRVDSKLPKTVDPDEHTMDSLLVWDRGASKTT